MDKEKDLRPTLNTDLAVKDFESFYWLKKELVDFCREKNIPMSGGKMEIAKRISSFLSTGQIPSNLIKSKHLTTSKFDWKQALLTKETIITDNYKNSENVRAFFEQMIGSSFKFNISFMQWMKTNQGKTLGDAISAWHKIIEKKKSRTTKKDIAPQFEYNRYLRDFMLDNPKAKRATGIQLWNIIKTKRGDNVYRKKDLDLLSD